MILMNDFKAEPAELRKAMVSAAERVFDSGWYILGKELEAFEQKWAQACGVSYSVGVGNGLDAIEISLRALGIGPGDEVITTPMTAFATVLAVIRAGAIPVLADIDEESALLSRESVMRCISPRTKAVLLVHLYGQLRDMEQWVELCNNNNIMLIEDCAQSHLAAFKGQYAGSFGIMSAFSFYPTKNLGAPGDAGAIVTSDPELKNMASCLRNYGQSTRYYHPELGLNSRLDELQAAILQERLNWLADFTAKRRTIAGRYFDEIRNPSVRLMEPPQEHESHVYHLFVLRCSERETLQRHLSDRGIQSLIHYPVPAHLQKPLSQVRTDPMGLLVSEKHAASCLSVPCHPQMTSDDCDRVISALNEFRL